MPEVLLGKHNQFEIETGIGKNQQTQSYQPEAISWAVDSHLSLYWNRITSSMPPDTISFSLSPLLLAMWHSSLLVPRSEEIAVWQQLPLTSCSLTDIGTCKEKQAETGSSSFSTNLHGDLFTGWEQAHSAFLTPHSGACSQLKRTRLDCLQAFEQWRMQGIGFRWIDFTYSWPTLVPHSAF